VSAHNYTQQKEPLIPSPVPDLPWEIATSDIFVFKGEHHLLLVDFYFEVTKLKDLTPSRPLKSHKNLSVYMASLSAKLVTGCGSQFTNEDLETFAKGYSCEHALVSPKYPKVNGEVEATVKTLKSQWKKNRDTRKALLEYRASRPLPGVDLSSSLHGLLEPETHST